MRTLVLLAIALLLIPAPALAKNRDKAWEFGAVGGFLDASKTSSDFISSFENSAAYGIRFGYNFSAKVEAEVFLDYQSTEANVEADPIVNTTMVDTMVDPNTEDFLGINQVPDNEDVTVVRGVAVITGNFLTDRESSTIPYVTVGLGVIQETRDAHAFTYNVLVSPDPNNPTMNFVDERDGEMPERFDSSAVLTIGVGARTFFTDNFGVRYEFRYIHHDSFDELADEFMTSVGITWIVGGQS